VRHDFVTLAEDKKGVPTKLWSAYPSKDMTLLPAAILE
jgi:hypothetical protein